MLPGAEADALRIDDTRPGGLPRRRPSLPSAGTGGLLGRGHPEAAGPGGSPASPTRRVNEIGTEERWNGGAGRAGAGRRGPRPHGDRGAGRDPGRRPPEGPPVSRRGGVGVRQDHARAPLPPRGDEPRGARALDHDGGDRPGARAGGGVPRLVAGGGRDLQPRRLPGGPEARGEVFVLLARRRRARRRHQGRPGGGRAGQAGPGRLRPVLGHPAPGPGQPPVSPADRRPPGFLRRPRLHGPAHAGADARDPRGHPGRGPHPRLPDAPPGLAGVRGPAPPPPRAQDARHPLPGWLPRLLHRDRGHPGLPPPGRLRSRRRDARGDRLERPGGARRPPGRGARSGFEPAPDGAGGGRQEHGGDPVCRRRGGAGREGRPVHLRRDHPGLPVAEREARAGGSASTSTPGGCGSGRSTAPSSARGSSRTR